MKRVVALQHADEEGPGSIVAWANDRRIELRCVRADLDALPSVDDADGFIVLGGPFSALANEPAWLVREREWIGEIVASGRPVFGICLGAQILAVALGATVERGHAEARWVDLELLGADDPRDTVAVRSWHDDSFALPPGAVRLARSNACEEQAFRTRDGSIGVQFHAEWTAEIVSAMHRRYGDAMPAALRVSEDDEAGHRLLDRLLDAWVTGDDRASGAAVAGRPGFRDLRPWPS